MLCPEENFCSLLLRMRVTTLEDIAKISFGCLYPKCPNSTGPVYLLALHSLVNISCSYYRFKTSLRDVFSADRSYSGKLFCFLKLGGGWWGDDFSSLEAKEDIKVKTSVRTNQLKLHKQCLDLSDFRSGHFPFFDEQFFV